MSKGDARCRNYLWNSSGQRADVHEAEEGFKLPSVWCEDRLERAIAWRVLCGGKAAGRDFHGNECYEHALIHVDDALVTSENMKSVLRDGLASHFEMSQESIGPPKFHFSGSIRQAINFPDLLVDLIRKERHVTSWDSAIVASENAEFVLRNVEIILSWIYHTSKVLLWLL